MIVFAFRYNECYHEGGPITYSLHKTKEGAEFALEKHKSERKAEWEKLCEWDNQTDDGDFAETCPFGMFEIWDIAELEVLD